MKVRVNHEMLIWAREQLNLSQDEVARRSGRKIEDIQAWENGTDYPTYAQLENISYSIYKKPIAIFFFSDKPNIKKQENEFRTLDNEVFKEIPTRILELINKARVMQINLSQIEMQQKIKLTQLDFNIKDLNFCNKLRDFLNVSMELQKKAKTMSDAFEMWRTAFYECGVYVFKDAFKDNSFSGFCLYDKDYPIIYINNSMSFSRQIFTLFHELYHIILKTSGIDKTKDDYIDRLDINKKKLEQLCNEFAGKFLVPENDLIEELKGKEINKKNIEKVAKIFSVSQEVVLRRLLDIGMINKEYYEEERASIINEIYRNPVNNGGGNYYNSQKSYLGEGYISDVCFNYYKGNIDIYTTAQYLNVKVEAIPKLGILLKEGSR